MCFFSPDGDLEIQERRPRYRGEPKRKRLAFVKDRSPRGSDDWDSRTHYSSNRSSVPEMWQRGRDSPRARFLEPRMPGQQPLYGQNQMFSQQPHYGQHQMLGQQVQPGLNPMLNAQAHHGQQIQPGINPMLNAQAHHGQQPMLGQQPQFAQPFRPLQPPGAAMMAQPNPIRPLPPMGFQQPLGGGRGNGNDIVQIIEPGRGQGRIGRGDHHRIENGPRARMPPHMRGRSNHRGHRRRDESVYSYDDDDDSFGSDQRLFRRSRSAWGSDSDDSFGASPGRGDGRFRR